MVFPIVEEFCRHSFVKKNVPGKLLLGDGAYFTVAQINPATEVRQGTECFQVLQKANAK